MKRKEEEMVEENKKGWKVENKRFLLTYKSHLPKETFKDYLNSLRAVEELYIAHENGKEDKECPYEHTHVAVAFMDTVKTRDPRFFDYEGIHPHIGPIKGSNWRKEWKKVKMYVSKEDPELKEMRDKMIEEDRPEEKPVLNIDGLHAHDNLTDAIKDPLVGVTEWSHIGGVVTAYSMRKIVIKKVIKADYKWQQDLESILKEEPDDRKVYWLYDKVGGTGKTQFCKYMMNKKSNNYHVVGNACGMRDFGTIISNAMNSGWNGHCLFFNMTRSTEDYKIYGPIEAAKDGLVTSTKYAGRTMIFDCAHVVVFANYLPDYSALSRDRWVTWELTGGGEYRVLHNIRVAPEERKAF